MFLINSKETVKEQYIPNGENREWQIFIRNFYFLFYSVDDDSIDHFFFAFKS